MKKASISEIATSERLWWNHNCYIDLPDSGKCELVAIHGKDTSNEGAYKDHDDSTLVSLKPASGKAQFQRMVANDTLFEVRLA